MMQVAQQKCALTLLSYVIRQCTRKTLGITCPNNH